MSGSGLVFLRCRLVFLWCPSVSFAGGEDVNERPVKEDRHFVRLNKGRMVVRSDGDDVGWDGDGVGSAETATAWSGLADESLRERELERDESLRERTESAQ